MLLKWDQTYSVMPVETSSGRSLSGCIIQQYSLPLPGKKGLLNIWKIEFDFLFKCIWMWTGDVGGGGIEIVPVGAAWMATKASCRVFLTDLRDFLAVSLGDVLEKWASSSAFWLRLRVEGSLIILVSYSCLPISVKIWLNLLAQSLYTWIFVFFLWLHQHTLHLAEHS